MAIFENPNEPHQPQKGVYGWYAKKGDKKITIYIGEAGKRNSSLPKGTLFRGVSELQRNTFSSNSPRYNSLDTDFIVGTAVIFFERRGYECVWKHISDNPEEEINFIDHEKPILQNEGNANIKEEFRARKQDTCHWKLNESPDKKERIGEAENEIFKQLLKYDR